MNIDIDVPLSDLPKLIAGCSVKLREVHPATYKLAIQEEDPAVLVDSGEVTQASAQNVALGKSVAGRLGVKVEEVQVRHSDTAVVGGVSMFETDSRAYEATFDGHREILVINRRIADELAANGHTLELAEQLARNLAQKTRAVESTKEVA